MRYYPFFKRLLDLLLSSIGLLGLSPLFYLAGILIKLDSPGTVFFKQERIGKNLKPFQLLKFRSMRASRAEKQEDFEPGEAGRVTLIGSLLRKTKLDELPELFNVLNGDMSIVGPRPEVRDYVTLNKRIFREIMDIKPGLTDYASIKYRNEEEMLRPLDDPARYYQQVILPDKLRLAKRYKDEISLRTDLYIIANTLKTVLVHRSPRDLHIAKAVIYPITRVANGDKIGKIP